MEWKEITEDTKEKYNLYLCSREWAKKRRAVFERARATCERCQYQELDFVHHLTYERKYQELVEDLQGVCADCHKFVHGKSDWDPLANREWMRYVLDCIDNDVSPIGIGEPVCDCSDVIAAWQVIDYCFEQCNRYHVEAQEVREKTQAGRLHGVADAFILVAGQIDMECAKEYALWSEHGKPEPSNVSVWQERWEEMQEKLD